jgi:hypothetical protein
MHGAISPLPTMPSWRGAQLKNRGILIIYIVCTGNYCSKGKGKEPLLPIGKEASIKNGLKQGDALSPLLLTLLSHTPLRRSDRMTGHISIWSMLTVLVY